MMNGLGVILDEVVLSSHKLYSFYLFLDGYATICYNKTLLLVNFLRPKVNISAVVNFLNPSSIAAISEDLRRIKICQNISKIHQ